MSKKHLELESLSAYLDGELEEHERSAVEEHLRACAECSATHSRLTTAAGSVSTLPRIEMSTDEHRELRQTILRARRTRSAGWSSSFLRWAAAGSLVVVAVAAAGLTFLRDGGRDRAGSGAVTEAAAPPAPLDFDFRSGREVEETVTSLPEVAASGSHPFRPEDAQSAQRSSRAMARTAPESEALKAPSQGSAPASAAPEPEAAADSYAGTASGGAPAASTPDPAVFREESAKLCREMVAGTQPYPMVSLVTRPATYQGTPAWLLVFAWSPEPVVGQPLERLQTWLVRPQDCMFSGSELESRALYRSFSDPT